MKKIVSFLFLFSLMLMFSAQNKKKAIDQLMTQWHEAAAKADFNSYFGTLHENSFYMGTDATERWNKKDFAAFSKPYFDRKKAWNFTALKRNINISKDGKTAWIDELLNTQMKICRGSGVLVFENGRWQIIQYVLSMTIPNDISNEVTKMKSNEEDELMQELRK